jgi:hypothetical protein
MWPASAWRRKLVARVATWRRLGGCGEGEVGGARAEESSARRTIVPSGDQQKRRKRGMRRTSEPGVYEVEGGGGGEVDVEVDVERSQTKDGVVVMRGRRCYQY